MGTTSNYSWPYPTVNADADTWGTTLNTAIVDIDASLKTVDDSAAAKLAKASNLSDLANAGTARTNLGLTDAATQSLSSGPGHNIVQSTGATTGNLPQYADGFGTINDSGIAASNLLTKSGNLSGLGSASTARSNLGLGSISTHNVTISSSAPSGGSDGDIWFQYA